MPIQNSTPNTNNCKLREQNLPSERIPLREEIQAIVSIETDRERQVMLLVDLFRRREVLLLRRANQQVTKTDVMVSGREKYENRRDKRESPVEFLRRVYPEARTGELFQFQLRQNDKKLLDVVRAWAKRNGKSMNEILPPKSSYNDKMLLRYPTLAQDASKLISALRRRNNKGE